MLVDRRELVKTLLLDVVGRDDHYYVFMLGVPFVLDLLHELLVVPLKPHILVKLGEGEGKPEVVSDSLAVLNLSKGSVEEVVSQLLDCEHALKTGVEVAEVGVVLESYDSIRQLGHLF